MDSLFHCSPAIHFNRKVRDQENELTFHVKGNLLLPQQRDRAEMHKTNIKTYDQACKSKLQINSTCHKKGSSCSSKYKKKIVNHLCHIVVTDDRDSDNQTAYWQSLSGDEVDWLCVTHMCLYNQPITTEYCAL